jgi:hypothetical protein
MADETAGGPLTDDACEAFYYETLNDARFDPPMLHEPLWTLNGRYPAATQRDRERLAENTLLTLLDRGLIQLYEFGGAVPIGQERARSLILGDAWRTLAVAAVLEIRTTPEGDRAHDLVRDQTWDRMLPDRGRPSSGPRSE